MPITSFSKHAIRRPQLFVLKAAPGWTDVLHDEVTNIVNNSFAKYKFPVMCKVKPNKTIALTNCDFRQGLEIALRVQCAHDMQWHLHTAPCKSYKELDMFIEHVSSSGVLSSLGIDTIDSTGTRLPLELHGSTSFSFLQAPRALKQIFQEKSNMQIPCDKVEGSPDECVKSVWLTLLRNELVMSTSLSGRPLYHRGYKSALRSAAPLPEHHAAACFRWLLLLLREQDMSSGYMDVLVPFAGSGTLGFEAVLHQIACSGGAIASRMFAYESFPVTPETTVRYLRRTIAERAEISMQNVSNVRIRFSDSNKEAVETLVDNIASFRSKLCAPLPAHAFDEPLACDFFDASMEELVGQTRSGSPVLLLLNPPYGNRMAKKSDVVSLYRKIAVRIDLIRKYVLMIHQSLPVFAGYCLIPNEEAWSAFSEVLARREFAMETRHFTHGGDDVRVVAFWSKMKQ